MRKTRAGIALSVLVFLCCVFTNVAAQERFRVIEVNIEGNRVASKSLILGVSSIDLGSPLSPANTTETIRRLYGLGIFEDVRIEAEEVTGGIKVYIIVKELPKLAGLQFSGNKKINTDDIKDKLSLGVGGYISPYLVSKKKNEIIDLYAEKGYFRAEVTPSLDYSADSADAILTYTIDEKSKVKVEKVIMTGAERVDPNDAIKKMRNRKRGFLKSSDFAQDKYEEDLTKVIAEFHKRGHLDAYLISDSMVIDSIRDRMTIFLDVYEGPRYYFGKVEFVGTEEMPSEYLVSKLKFKEGDVFNQEKYEESISEVYTAYYDIGHLNIGLADDRTTRADSILDISYEIAEGLPSHVKLIKIVGNRRTKEKVIRRELKILPGQRFTREALMRSVREVMALNYFDDVLPEPVSRPDGDVDIEVKVTERQTGQVSAGAGYNSQDKLVGNLGMGIPNFRGNGQNLSFNTEFGSNRNSVSLSFTEPWLFGRPTLMGSSLYSTNRRWYDDYTEGRQGGSLRLGRRLRWPDNYFQVVGSYRLERDRFYDFEQDFIEDNSYSTRHLVYFEVIDDEVSPPDIDTVLVKDVTTYSEQAYPGSILDYDEEWLTSSQIAFTISRDSRNLPEFATSGSKLTYTFEQTGGFLGGFWKSQRHQITFAKFIPLFWKFALAAKAQYGVVTSPGGGDDQILLSDRFTPGGTAYDGIVRGYNDGVLTPDSSITQSDTIRFYSDIDTSLVPGSGAPEPDSIHVNTGTVRVRGKYLFVTNLELQFPIVDRQIYGLFFFDAGNSWLRKENLFDKLYRGAGVGFRVVV
ncbi:MAG: outer membrane protein assembly factor BamA, partial [candidate division Zixibacteria bacterium]|nr:outer membrane protein assembly factor BamA [candidate division Zixibacteria bacterium]